MNTLLTDDEFAYHVANAMHNPASHEALRGEREILRTIIETMGARFSESAALRTDAVVPAVELHEALDKVDLLEAQLTMLHEDAVNYATTAEKARQRLLDAEADLRSMAADLRRIADRLEAVDIDPKDEIQELRLIALRLYAPETCPTCGGLFYWRKLVQQGRYSGLCQNLAWHSEAAERAARLSQSKRGGAQ